MANQNNSLCPLPIRLLADQHVNLLLIISAPIVAAQTILRTSSYMSNFIDTHETFQTRGELIDYVRLVCRNSGYGVSIKCSIKDKRVYLACNRGGKYRKRLAKASDEPKRHTGRRFSRCHWEIYGSKKSLMRFWTLELRNSQHNHGTSVNMTGHPVSMQSEENRTVRKIWAYFKKKFLQKVCGRRVSVQDVYNPPKEIRSRLEKSSSALWKYFDFSGRGAHAALKRYLQISTSNLDLVMTRMTQAVKNQAWEIEAIIFIERIQVPHAFRNAHCFEQLIGRVSVFGLRKLAVERERSYECAEKPCSHSIQNLCQCHVLMSYFNLGVDLYF